MIAGRRWIRYRAIKSPGSVFLQRPYKDSMKMGSRKTTGFVCSLDRASMREWQPHHLPARGSRLSVDRMRVLQGHGVGAVQDAPRAGPDAQRHDARSAGAADVV